MNSSAAFNLAISIVAFCLVLALAATSFKLSHITILKEETRNFRETSYQVKTDVPILHIHTLQNLSDCVLINRIENKRHLSYETFMNACDFIWAEAQHIHNKFNKQEREMAGVGIIEGGLFYRYYPLYKNEYGNLEFDGGHSAGSGRVTVNEYRKDHYISRLNQSLRNSGYY